MAKHILFLFLLLMGTRAYCMDGNGLLAICASVEKTELSETDSLNLQFCYGYIQGVIDADGVWQGMMSYDKNHTHDKSKYCLPEEGALYTQLARVVVKFMKDHPENLHWGASVLVHNSFIKAFPCSANSH